MSANRRIGRSYADLVDRDKSTRAGQPVEILVRFRVDDINAARDFFGSLHHSSIKYLGVADRVVPVERLADAQSLIKQYESAPRVVSRPRETLNIADVLHAIETCGRYIAPDGRVWLSQERFAEENHISMPTVSRITLGKTKSASAQFMPINDRRYAFLSGSYSKVRKSA